MTEKDEAGRASLSGMLILALRRGGQDACGGAPNRPPRLQERDGSDERSRLEQRGRPQHVEAVSGEARGGAVDWTAGARRRCRPLSPLPLPESHAEAACGQVRRGQLAGGRARGEGRRRAHAKFRLAPAKGRPNDSIRAAPFSLSKP